MILGLAFNGPVVSPSPTILMSCDRKNTILSVYLSNGDAFNHKIQAWPLIYVVGKRFPQVTEAEPDCDC